MVEEAEANSSMSALAILSCRQNSHPFQERHIALLEPMKIGRSVARARPAPNNGIFDCKVLSRNHAMLWYENGIFYLQDTKSSNGTFVNDQRLCKGGEESPPREIYSGDLIQFGVNVMENNRRGEKITHGCIIATITLFHPDGREAKPVLFNTPTPGITIQSQELYRLAQYLQEALHREKMLEQKLSTLQKLVQNTQESSEGGWQALIDEDRLLSRLEVLENQLHAYSKNHTEDTLRQELVQLQEEKLNYETTAKESLMKVLQEKIEAVTKLSDLERSLTKSEDECGHMKDMCEQSQEELQLLAEKYQDQLKAVQDIQIQLQDAETKHMEEIEKAEKDKLDLQDKLDEMMKQEAALTAKIEGLQADQDISNEQLTTMKARLDQFKDTNEDDHINNMKALDSDSEKMDSESEVISSVIIKPTVKADKESTEDVPEDVEGKLKETQKQIEEYKLKREEQEKQLQESAEKVEQLQRDLEASKLESLQYVAKIAALEVQMTETSKQSLNSNDLINHLQEQVSDLERELALYKIPQPEKSLDTTLVCSGLDTVDSLTIKPRYSSVDDSELEKLLQDAKRLLAKTEDDLGKCKEELNESQTEAKQAKEENSALKTELTQAQTQVQDKSEMVIDLQEQLQKAENTTKEVKEQILELRDQLVEEQKVSKLNQEEIATLKGNLEEEKTKHKETLQHLETAKSNLEEEKSKHEATKNSLVESKKSLSESQQATKQSQNEATQLRNKLRHQPSSPSPDIVEMRNGSRERRSTPEKRTIPHTRYSFHIGDTPSKLPMSKRQANEFLALKEECASLRKRIQAIEGEMKMSRKENLQLSAEYNKLQESYKQLEEVKDRLADKESTWMSNLTDSQKETENTLQEVRLGDSDSLYYNQQLQEAKEEIKKLKKKCEDCDQEILRLKTELKRMSGDYGRIAGRSKIISFVSCIPLLMLLFAILLALYPSLETLTASQT
ncbi:sarcolemmal membrane-associated protein-like isoform X3 [Mercenaria mercenaria]|uniref:sarcolemmal membrane-associated protein-like isoform X3 n=1 Tax=Mercenaria mercenaria TaxID=6596 RepID=UPI00234E562D|nr:sarcolemmal membrane-associated protein-like isoform X3 [Mercenaria mercenaria]